MCLSALSWPCRRRAVFELEAVVGFGFVGDLAGNWIVQQGFAGKKRGDIAEHEQFTGIAIETASGIWISEMGAPLVAKIGARKPVEPVRNMTEEVDPKPGATTRAQARVKTAPQSRSKISS
jgi:hypothetical protein